MPSYAVVVPDPSFGDDGTAYVTGIDDLDNRNVHLAVATDGTLMFAMVGRGTNGGHRLAVGKLQPDGKVDLTFGGGVAQMPVGNPAHSAELARLLPLADGGLLAFVRLLRGPGIGDAVLLRLGHDGNPSHDFNNGRPLSISLPLTFDAWTLHGHGDGFLIASMPSRGPGYTLSPMTHGNARVLRVTSDGRIDAGFGRAGLVELPDLPGRFGDILLRPDGSFQILHTAERSDGRAINRWRRYRADGTPDAGDSDGWYDVGDDGSRHLVSVFALTSGRHAVVNEQSMFAGYLDRDGRMTTPMNFLGNTRIVQPFDRGRALVGIHRESGLLPTPADGAFAVAVDATGVPDGLFSEPRSTGVLRLAAPISRYNFVADSPWTFAVAGYHPLTGVRILRYLEIRGDGGARPIPAATAPALLVIAAIVLLASAGQLKRRVNSRSMR